MCASEAIASRVLLRTGLHSRIEAATAAPELQQSCNSASRAIASEAHTRLHIEAATAATELQQSCNSASSVAPHHKNRRPSSSLLRLVRLFNLKLCNRAATAPLLRCNRAATAPLLRLVRLFNLTILQQSCNSASFAPRETDQFEAPLALIVSHLASSASPSCFVRISHIYSYIYHI